MIVFPRTDIFDLCKIRTAKFWPLLRQELSRTAGAGSQAKDLGSPLWAASYTTAPARLRDAQAIEAALISLNGSVGSFLAYDTRRPFPAAHADGNFADTAQIAALDAENAFHLTLGGLPQGFTLSAGDYLGFSFGPKPSRALHIVTIGGVAGANGEIPLTVSPWVRPGTLVGAAVTLKRAPCEMSLDGAPPEPSPEGMVASTNSFSAVQIF
ncbi:hypothetical protein [Cribrihabitans pelagius]|uniref:hypothetical protein n=1 Tax=Cribrihabitans pelagius TaxID=1765746 RepID=UPI003B597D87